MYTLLLHLISSVPLLLPLLSIKGYAQMTRMLMSVGNGRVALALEGGYELMSLCASAEACMKALLGLEVGTEYVSSS